MRAFDAVDFNQPTGRELERRIQVARRRLKRIARLISKDPHDIRLVDVGCSRGQFVSTAAGMGMRAEGVEPAGRIAAAARASGLRVHHGKLEDVRFETSSFDAVTLFEVIEHLKDPLPLLQECRRILRPQGVLCLTTGNAQSWTVRVMGARWDYFSMEQDGGHISFYNPRSIALLGARSGFDVIAVETARMRFSEKSGTSRLSYAIAKAAGELLSLPARFAQRGHDMIAYLRPR
jgi:2-polyprenyl-3-methyl-5-hydroxy-6-metoxy-1,4-benzoquinol methylase